jgi:dolichyl-diphosphooligosaccharide--protein glycosyltransferase
MAKEERGELVNFASFKFSRKHLMIIAVLVMAFAIAFMLRSMPLQYGFYLNEFDPYFDYRATKFIVDNGIDAYLNWHDTMSWYPEGRDIAATSQTGLHLTTASLYSAFGGGAPLYDFVVWFPVVFGSFTAIVVFALVRVLSSTTAGLFAALFFAVSPAIIQRGNLGWFKSEPLGLFLALLATYLLLSALKHNDIRFAIAKAVGGGLLLTLANASWGGVQYFSLLLGLFFIAIPFFRKDRMPLYVVPIFAIITVATAIGFPRIAGKDGYLFGSTLPGLALWIPAIVFIGVSYAIMMKSNPQKQQRNLLAWLGAFIIGSSVFIAAGSYVEPSFRYISVINPFGKSEIPLVESVAEHFTPTIVDYFANYSVLILLAGYGVMLCFKKRNEMTIFALIAGITGIYISASFSRLMVFSSISIIILASIALYEITSAIFSRVETAPAAQPKKKVKIQSTSKDFRLAYTAIIIAMLATPMFVPRDAGWVSATDIPPSIANGATSFKVTSNDWIDTMQWIKNDTTQSAVIAAWWDYGYWITTLGERTTLADNATINMTRIENIAKVFFSDEKTGWQMLKDMGADYVLVYVVGQRAPAPDGTNFVLLGGGGDESKKHWFMRIAGVNEFQYLEDDGFTPTPLFWNSTLLGKMFPVEPAAYVSLDRAGNIADSQAEYRSGYTPIYIENLKYPENGDGPLRLAYGSPSFMNKNERLVLGVLIYEIVKDWKPPVEVEKPMGEEVTLPSETGEPLPTGQYATLQTNYGNITMQFFPDVAPKTVESIVKLIDSGFYDGIKFHRVIPDFVIQAGDPNTKSGDKSTWGFGGPGFFLPAEISDLKHTRGMVSMAHPGDPNKAGSQFFIVVKDAPHLDGKYTIFGKVVEGMDVVDNIVQVPRDPRDIPIMDVMIEKAYTFKK